MAELVDALDLGSSALVAWEFESPRSHHGTRALSAYFLLNIRGDGRKVESCIKNLEHIAEDRTHGSSYIASRILEYSEECAKKKINFTQQLFKLLKSHSSMAVVINVVLDVIKDPSPHNINFLKKNVDESRYRSVLEALEHLNGIKKIATISHSQAVSELIYSMKPECVYLSVAHPLREGETFSIELASNGIRTVLFEDTAYGLIMNEVECVIVGADAVIGNNFVNKIGTRMLALLSADLRKPFYVLADKMKWLTDNRSQYFAIPKQDAKEVSKITSDVINVYFERIPNRLVTRFFKG